MQTTLGSVTEYFQRLVNARAFENVDECWEAFVVYLCHRTKAIPAAMIKPFHGASDHDLIRVIERWLEKGVTNLIEPNCDDNDAEYFREFCRNDGVLGEVQGFVAERYSHLF